MADEALCRPAEGTKHGTLHWLADGGRQRLAVWIEGDRWRFPNGTTLSGDQAAELGWRYDGLAASLV